MNDCLLLTFGSDAGDENEAVFALIVPVAKSNISSAFAEAGADEPAPKNWIADYSSGCTFCRTIVELPSLGLLNTFFTR